MRGKGTDNYPPVLMEQLAKDLEKTTGTQCAGRAPAWAASSWAETHEQKHLEEEGGTHFTRWGLPSGQPELKGAGTSNQDQSRD